MIDSHSLSPVLRDLMQLSEVRGRKFSIIFVFGFENKTRRGKVSVGVDFVDIGLSKASGIKVIGVLDKFLFSFLSFELIKFEIVASTGSLQTLIIVVIYCWFLSGIEIVSRDSGASGYRAGNVPG